MNKLHILVLVSFAIQFISVMGQLPSTDAKIYSAKIETGWTRYGKDVTAVSVAIALMLVVLCVIFIADCCMGGAKQDEDRITRDLHRWKEEYNL